MTIPPHSHSFEIPTATTQEIVDGIEGSKVVTPAALKPAMEALASSVSVGAAINGAAAKTTPANADAFGIVDSEDENVLKKLSWSNLVTALQTAFSSVFAAIAHTHTFASLTGKPITIAGYGITDPNIVDIAALTDPGADRIPFWDDSAKTIVWLAPGTNMSISGTNLNSSGGGGGGGGDMFIATYDPTGKNSDAFDMDNMVESATKKILSSTERTKLAGIEASADVTDAANIAPAIAGVSAKATPADADVLGLLDSAALFVLKNFTWANAKAALKNHFDGFYQALDGELTAIAGLTSAADELPYFIGPGTAATTTMTAFARSVLDDADAATARATLDAEKLGEQVGINTQTGSTYTLALTDKGKVVEMNNASSNTLTVPPNSSVALPVNSRIDLSQIGSGQTTIAAGVGVTIRSSGGKLKIAGQYSGATLYKRATNEWVLVGSLAS